MAAPLVSVTVPSIVPRNVCAEAGIAPAAVNINAAQNIRTRTPQPRRFPLALFLPNLKADLRDRRGSASSRIKRTIVEPLRPNPRNERCNSYKRKELQSQAHIIDGAHTAAGIASRRLLYWSVRGLPPDGAGRASRTISETECLQKPQNACS